MKSQRAIILALLFSVASFAIAGQSQSIVLEKAQPLKSRDFPVKVNTASTLCTGDPLIIDYEVVNRSKFFISARFGYPKSTWLRAQLKSLDGTTTRSIPPPPYIQPFSFDQLQYAGGAMRIGTSRSGSDSLNLPTANLHAGNYKLEVSWDLRCDQLVKGKGYVKAGTLTGSKTFNIVVRPRTASEALADSTINLIQSSYRTNHAVDVQSLLTVEPQVLYPRLSRLDPENLNAGDYSAIGKGLIQSKTIQSAECFASICKGNSAYILVPEMLDLRYSSNNKISRIGVALLKKFNVMDSTPKSWHTPKT